MTASAPEAAAEVAAGAIRGKALALGFDAVGFAPAALGPEARSRLRDFLAAGQHGDMGWLADRSAERGHPQALWPEARSVVALGLSYAPGFDAMENLERADCGTISVYARNRDYHDVLRGKLKHLAQFMVSRFGGDVKVFVDTAPVMEKPLAEAAGLGWQGKHTNLVSRAHGSWLFLGEVFTTLALTPSTPPVGSCGSCSRCLAVCPTDAFPAPYRLNATRCISYLTIEHRGPIPLELRPLMGNRIYGCDDCLAVCPWNRFARPGRDEKLRPRADLAAPSLAALAGLDDAAFRAMFAGSPVKRIGRGRFVRNVLNAIGNSGDAALLPVALGLIGDADPVVAEAASWAAARLAPPAVLRGADIGAQQVEDLAALCAGGPAVPLAEASAASRFDSPAAPQVDGPAAPRVASPAAPRLDSSAAPQLGSSAAPQLGSSAAPQLGSSARSAAGQFGRSAAGVLIKRSFSLAGHRTSVALEGEFWDALAAIAGRDGVTLAALVARMDGARAPETPLASALRVLALRRAAEETLHDSREKPRLG